MDDIMTAKGGKRVSGTISVEKKYDLEDACVRLGRYISPDIGGKGTLCYDHVIAALILDFLSMNPEQQLNYMRIKIRDVEQMRKAMDEASGAGPSAPVKLEGRVNGIRRKKRGDIK